MNLKSNQRLVGSRYAIGLIEDAKVVVRAGKVGGIPLNAYVPFGIGVGGNIADCLTRVYDTEDKKELLEEFLTNLKEYENEVH